VSEASEAELRERMEEQGAGAEEPDAGGGAPPPLFLPTPDFMASAGEGYIRFHFVVSLRLSFCNPLGAYHTLGQAWAEGKRAACNVPPLCGQRTGNGLYIFSP